MTRPSWQTYFRDLARQVATRATCPRKSVGAILVKNGHVQATGYNGSMAGEQHCDDVGCLMVEGHCARTIHAEVNAVAQAARNGVRLEGAACYVTAKPCWTCLKLLVNSGVKLVWYEEDYGAEYPAKPPITVVRLRQEEEAA